MTAKAQAPDPNSIDVWTKEGDVSIDSDKSHDGKKAIKVSPGGSATLRLRNEVGGGKVTMWVFEEGKARDDAKARHQGPRWGVAGLDGKAVAGGIMHAPYLDGNKYYSVAERTGPAWGKVVYVRQPERADRWTKWVFDFDKDGVPTVSVDDEKITTYPGDASVLKTGFDSLLLVGDDAKDNGTMNVWVADISVDLGAATGAGSTSAAPAPGPSASAAPTPAAAPLAYDANAAVSIDVPPSQPNGTPAPAKIPPPVPEGQHPRLILTSDEIADIASHGGKDIPETKVLLGVATGMLKDITFPDPKGPMAQVKDRGDAVAKAHGALSHGAGNLGLAYAMTKDEKFAQKAAEILKGYAERYDQYAEHKGVNGNDTGKIMAQRLSEAMWIIPLILSYDYIYDSGALTADDKKLIETKLIRPCIEFIRNKHGVEAEVAARDKAKPGWRDAMPALGQGKPVGNWLIWYNSATIAGGVMLKDQAMIDLGIADMKMLIRQGIGSDGMWGEGAIGYQAFATAAMLVGVEAAAHQGVDLWSFDNNRMKLLFDSVLRYSYPDGSAPGINDSSRRRGGDANAIPYQYAYLRYADPAYIYIVNDSPHNMHFSEGLNFPSRIFDRLPEPGPISYPSTVFENVGYAILRSPNTFALIDYGQHGGVHGHYDKLNLILYCAGPDGKGDEMGGEPNFHKYEDALHDQWTKETIAHNTLAVDESNQKEATGKPVIFEDTPAIKVMRAEAGTAYPGVLLDRTVVVLGDAVIDLYLGLSSGAHTWDRTFRYQGNLSAIAGMVESNETLGTKDGYQHIKIAGRIPGDKPWMGSWATKVGAFNVTVAPAPGQEIILATGPDKDQIMYARQKGTGAAFAATYQLASWSNAVTAIDWLPEAEGVKVAKVAQADGSTCLVFVGAGKPWAAQGWKSDARLLVVQEVKGQQRVLLGGGTTAEGKGGAMTLPAMGNGYAEGPAGALKLVKTFKGGGA